MSAEIITQTTTADATSRGQGRKRNSNRNPRGGNNAHPAASNQGSTNRNTRGSKEKKDNVAANNRDTEPTERESTGTIVAAPPSETGDSDNVCWICAEPVKYYSISECNHRTCHVCAIRLRALYKKTDCTFCKVRLGVFIFLSANIFCYLGSTDCGYFYRLA